MKILVLMFATLMSTASFAGPSMECVEFSPEAFEGELTLKAATQQLKDGNISIVDFIVIDNSTLKDCPKIVQEVDANEEQVDLNLDAAQSNKNCVYKTNDDAIYEYGYVCKKN